MRASNAVAIVLLFVTGFFFGRVSQLPSVAVGLTMVVLGLVLVGITIALGG
jgi:Ni,Fe-hydrogenase I cytochrome b subunit